MGLACRWRHSACSYVLGVRDWRCYGVALMWPPVISAIQTGNLTLWLALACARRLAVPRSRVSRRRRASGSRWRRSSSCGRSSSGSPRRGGRGAPCSRCVVGAGLLARCRGPRSASRASSTTRTCSGDSTTSWARTRTRCTWWDSTSACRRRLHARSGSPSAARSLAGVVVARSARRRADGVRPRHRSVARAHADRVAALLRAPPRRRRARPAAARARSGSYRSRWSSPRAADIRRRSRQRGRSALRRGHGRSRVRASRTLGFATRSPDSGACAPRRGRHDQLDRSR